MKMLLDKVPMIFVASVICFGLAGLTGISLFSVIGVALMLPFFLCVIGAFIWQIIAFIDSFRKRD